MKRLDEIRSYLQEKQAEKETVLQGIDARIQEAHAHLLEAETEMKAASEEEDVKAYSQAASKKSMYHARLADLVAEKTRAASAAMTWEEYQAIRTDIEEGTAQAAADCRDSIVQLLGKAVELATEQEKICNAYELAGHEALQMAQVSPSITGGQAAILRATISRLPGRYKTEIDRILIDLKQ